MLLPHHLEIHRSINRSPLLSPPRRQILHDIFGHTAFRGEHPDDASIVYCLSCKKVEETAAWLTEHGWDALPHAATRRNNQNRFLQKSSKMLSLI